MSNIECDHEPLIGTQAQLLQRLHTLKEYFPDWDILVGCGVPSTPDSDTLMFWRRGDRLVRFGTMTCSGTCTMVRVTGYSCLRIEDRRFECGFARGLDLALTDAAAAGRMRELLAMYDRRFAELDHVPGAAAGMAELARPLLGGVDVRCVDSSGADPFGLTELMVPRYFGLRSFAELVGSGAWDSEQHCPMLHGRRVSVQEVVLLALDAPAYTNPAQVFAGTLDGWTAIATLSRCLNELRLPALRPAYEERPQLAGAVLFGALCTYAAHGYRAGEVRHD